jgi:hypothetical protein
MTFSSPLPVSFKQNPIEDRSRPRTCNIGTPSIPPQPARDLLKYTIAGRVASMAIGTKTLEKL